MLADDPDNKPRPPLSVADQLVPPQFLWADCLCLGCGCLCDDLVIETESDGSPRLRTPCPLGQGWLSQTWDQSATARTVARIRGVSCSAQTGINHAAQILKSARSLLVTGLCTIPMEAQRSAIRLGLRFHAVIDPDFQTEMRAWLDVERRLGWVTATWGEIRARTDLYVLWGSIPEKNIPRWRERLVCLDAKHPCIQVCLDPRDTPTAPAAIHIPTGSERQALESLRLALQLGLPDVPDFPAADPLLKAVRSARSVAWIIGTPREHSRLARTWAYESIARLSRQQNARQRFRVIHAPEDEANPNSAGAISVLTWLSGGAHGMDARSASALFDPLGAEASRLIERQEVDAVLQVGSIHDELANRLRSAVPHIAWIVVAPGATATPTFTRDVELEAAIPGLEAGGTYLRGDGLPLRSEPILPAPPCPSTLEWLNRIERSLAETPPR